MQILLKALMTLPNADFIMCRSLIDDANVSFIVGVTYEYKNLKFRTLQRNDHFNKFKKGSNIIKCCLPDGLVKVTA